MIFHFVVGDEAAKNLLQAVVNEPDLEGEVVVLKDILHVGPLQKSNGESFSVLRTNYWREVAGNEDVSPVQDLERVLEISNTMAKNENAVAWMWMAPAAADVCAYYWLFPFLYKHTNRFFLLNLAGLPFLNEEGKVYFPNSLSEIIPSEFLKARKLARNISPSEMEVDTDEWQKLVEENAALRSYEGGKKITSRGVGFYDEMLLQTCTAQPQKTSKIIRLAIQKSKIPTGDTWIQWRLKKLVAENIVEQEGETIRLSKNGAENEVNISS